MMDALISFLAAIVGGVIVIFGQYLLSEILRKRDANYAAIRIVCLLEQYFEKCLEVVLDDGTVMGMPAGRTAGGETCLEPQVNLPPAVEYPEDINWKSVRPKLMFRAFKLSNAAVSTSRNIDAAREVSDPPDYEEYFEARHEGYARLGIEALDLSRAFRRAYGIPMEAKSALDLHWDPEECVRSVLKQIEDGRKFQVSPPPVTLQGANTKTGNT